MPGRKPGFFPPATVAERQAKARSRRQQERDALIRGLREIKDEAPTISRAREIATQALALVDWR